MRRVDAAYSEYMATCWGVSFLSARSTAGPHPEVFSLKSRRNLFSRSSAGVSYVFRCKMALRTGSRTFIGAPRQHLRAQLILRLAPEFEHPAPAAQIPPHWCAAR